MLTDLKSMQNLGKNCKVCMEWKEHCYWSHMADEKKHFFKLVAGDFTESISIPGRFSSNFNGQISEVVTLKSATGKTWSIGVGGDTDEVVLRSGWKEFASNHSLEEGDYLLFRYTGASSFDVLIFDSSGCEKTSPHFPERIEHSPGIEGARPNGRRFNTRQDHTPQSQSNDDDDDDDEAHLERLPTACKRSLRHDIEQAHCEVKDDEDDTELEEGDAPAKTGYYFCKNGPVSEYHLTEQDKEEISSIPVPVQSPTNPVFVQVMHPSHVRARGKKCGMVGISSEFAVKYLGAVGREIILERASSRGRWHVRYNCNRFSRGLNGRGWSGFVGDNSLLDHDVCLFELITGTRRPTMAVHVLRKLRGRYVLLR
ncbi:hypothetical protein ACP4OV_007605 [Aristida adscensionis]